MRKYWLIIISLSVIITTILTGCLDSPPPKKTATTSAVTYAQKDYVDKLASDLGSRLSTNEKDIKTLQSNTSSLSVTNFNNAITAANKAASDIAGVSKRVDSLEKNTNGWAELQNRVKSLEAARSQAGVVIGTTSTTVNGLTVTFLINPTTLSTVAGVTGSVQPSVKIANNTGKSVLKLDIAGTIVFGTPLYGIANGYPTMTDANTAAKYSYAFSGNTITFEVFQDGSGNALSIPNGGSLTLRPNITVQGTTGVGYSTTATMAIGIITYDIGN